MDFQIMGSPCPKCGGCDYYCADCYDKQVAELEAVANAARTLLAGIDPFKVDDAEARLTVAVDRWLGAR